MRDAALTVIDTADSTVRQESFTLLELSRGEEKRGIEIFDIAVSAHNIRRYGADPGGANSSTSAIQEAIDCCYESGGGYVVIPQGTFLIDAPCIGRTGVTIIGEGYGSCLKMANGAAFTNNIIKFENAQFCGVKNFRLDGNRTTSDGGTRYGIYFGGCSQVVCEGMYTHDHQGDGIHLYNCEIARVSGNFSYGNFYHGLEIEQCRSVIARGNACYANFVNGIYCFEGEVGAQGSHCVQFEGNVCQSNLQGGLIVQGRLSSAIGVRGNIMRFNNTYGCSIFDRVRAVTVQGNLIEANGYDGLYLYRIEAAVIVGNSLRNNSQAGNGAHHEIFLQGDVTQYTKNCTIDANTIIIDDVNKAAYAIKEASTNDGPNVIRNNTVPYAGTAGKIAVLYESSLPSSFSLCRGNIGRISETRGTATFSGNASQTVFTIAHGMVDDEPRYANVGAGSPDARGPFSWAVDPTNITVTYGTAPPSGTGNVILRWKAET
jgi:pectate lyase-like protein